MILYLPKPAIWVFIQYKGMLKGFIDLVFEHQGQYFILDWKSNYLGDSVSDYHGDALNNAMAEHRYDLQYQIYALALHRFLRSRLPIMIIMLILAVFITCFYVVWMVKRTWSFFMLAPSLPLLNDLDSLIDGHSIEPKQTDSGQMELI